MKVLVACEYSGIVRDAFIARGHDAWSADLEDSEKPGQHITGDLFTPAGEWAIDVESFDLLIAHPPCTYLAGSGARWWATRQVEQRKAIWFFLAMANAPVDRVCVENPVGCMSTLYRKPDQYIQPWQFGHGETKRTCLWLRGLPLLTPTNIVPGREQRIHTMSPGPGRSRERSRTYQGWADEMAEQWG